MYPDIEHPELTHIERTGYPSWYEREVLNDEDDESEETEIYGDDCEDDYDDFAFEERRESDLFDDE